MVQPKESLKVPVSEWSRVSDKVIPIPDYAIPQMRSSDNSNSRRIKRKGIQDISREISKYPDPIHRPPRKPVEIPMEKLPRNLLDLDPEINMEFKEKSPFQEGMISKMYQRPEKSYFQEPQELDSQINTGKLVQKFLMKQAYVDKILKIIHRKVLKGTHFPVTVKEIQAEYLISVIDEVTNYLITVPIHQYRFEEISYAKYCGPDYIIMDQDSAFMSSLMNYLFKKLDNKIVV